ncbi:MAG: hypothetical protein ACLSWV_07165 [Pygmaiobacter massiliensis]|uniref:hypothetical protein n=1 Tax=Pygmaiobacter massiliensis TaxID=1917873 RepID=UPI00289F15A9|nr:hypothetical protein [Pygmaiobacter massiliensis]
MKMKKVLALCLSALLCVSLFAGCGKKSFDSVLTVDGTPITPGIYRLYQSIAYTEASRSVPDASKDMFSQKIEDKSVSDWIYDRTVSLLQSFVYFQREFDRLKLSFTEEEQKQMNETIESEWKEVSGVYEKNGVTKEDFTVYDESSFKVQKVFLDSCSDLSEEQVKDFFNKNFALITYTQLPLMDSTGNALSEEAAKKVAAIAEKALAETKDGASFMEAALPAITDAYKEAGFDITSYKPENFVMRTYLNLDNEDGKNALGETVSKVDVNNIGMHKADGQYYVLFQRLENYSSQDEFEALKLNVLLEMRSDEYNAKAEPIYKAYEIVADSAAVKYYDPKKLDLTEPPVNSAASALTPDEDTTASSSSAASSEAASGASSAPADASSK